MVGVFSRVMASPCDDSWAHVVVRYPRRSAPGGKCSCAHGDGGRGPTTRPAAALCGATSCSTRRGHGADTLSHGPRTRHMVAHRGVPSIHHQEHVHTGGRTFRGARKHCVQKASRPFRAGTPIVTCCASVLATTRSGQRKLSFCFKRGAGAAEIGSAPRTAQCCLEGMIRSIWQRLWHLSLCDCAGHAWPACFPRSSHRRGRF